MTTEDGKVVWPAVVATLLTTLVVLTIFELLRGPIRRLSYSIHKINHMGGKHHPDNMPDGGEEGGDITKPKEAA